MFEKTIMSYLENLDNQRFRKLKLQNKLNQYVKNLNEEMSEKYNNLVDKEQRQSQPDGTDFQKMVQFNTMTDMKCKEIVRNEIEERIKYEAS